jgi:DNA-binding CsgD family transcriptional regulator
LKQLTDRETQILKLVADGKRQKEIASQLNLSVKTITAHVTNITNKTGIKGIANLTKYALSINITT